MFIDKGGILALSKKGKIILLVSVVVAIGIFLAVFFSQKKQQDLATEPTAVPGESAVVLEKIYENPDRFASKTPSAEQTVGSSKPRATASPSATVPVGYFDYTNLITVTPDPATKARIEQTEKIIKNGEICQEADISDTWSNPFEKSICGILKFTFKQIESLSEFSCYLYAGAMANNYSSNITAKYEEGTCKLIDR